MAKFSKLLGLSMKKVNITVISLAAVSMGILIKFYDKLPSMVPNSWNFRGEVDDYIGKQWLLLLNFLPVLLLIIFNVVLKIGSIKDKYKNNEAYHGGILFGSLFGIVMFNMPILMSFDHGIDIGQEVLLIIGVILIMLGNVTPRVKNDSSLGMVISTPWTRASRKVWVKTHRLGGILFVLCGFVAFICAFLPGTVRMVIFFSVFISVTVLLSLYSLFLYRKFK